MLVIYKNGTYFYNGIFFSKKSFILKRFYVAQSNREFVLTYFIYRLNSLTSCLIRFFSIIFDEVLKFFSNS